MRRIVFVAEPLRLSLSGTPRLLSISLSATRCGNDYLAAVPGISATPYEDNLRYFNVVITGPEQSPYESERCVDRSTRE